MSCSHQLIKLLRLPQQYFNLPNKMTLMSENYRCYHFINELKCSLVTTWYLYFTNFYKVKYIFQFLSVFNKFAIKSVKCILHSLSNFSYMWAPFRFWGQIALLHMVFFFFFGFLHLCSIWAKTPNHMHILWGLFNQHFIREPLDEYNNKYESQGQSESIHGQTRSEPTQKEGGWKRNCVIERERGKKRELERGQ